MRRPLADVHWHTSKSCAAGNCIEIAAVGDGLIAIRDSKDPDGPVLTYTTDEWTSFLTGAKNGDFDHL